MNTRNVFLTYFFMITQCAAAEYIGKPLPQGNEPAQGRSEISEWDSVALDGVSGKAILDALSKSAIARDVLNTRGPKEIQVYRDASPAVVLIVTKDATGSGSYLGSGRILTNWHVVRAAKSVAVLFKPQQEGAKLDLSGLVRADVLRTDRQRDLALLEVAVVPQSLRPLELGTPSELQVGADVHAIGHPSGQAWTYTRGLISQIRQDYEWKTSDGHHRANVIQTQTPINPGSSGGPLIGDSGKLLGVNSFKSTQGDAINFAVSVADVTAFLAADSPNAVSTANAACTPVRLYEGVNRANDGKLIQIDSNCDGTIDVTFLTPNDRSKPISMLVDSNHDGKIDIIVEDTDRDGRWDTSYHDVDHDDMIDIVGHHPDGKLKPSRFEKYAEAK